MQFRIADTFTDSLARLMADEQKAVKTTAFDLQVNLAHPSLQFHKLEKSRDPGFSSIRVSRDLRIIVHRTPGSLLLCYVGHHDAAYAWAGSRKLLVHPTTGAAQLVEVRETFEEIRIPQYINAEAPATPKRPLLAKLTDDTLLSYGVPPEWIADVRAVTEDNIFSVVEHLPGEAAEAVLELATGGVPQPAVTALDYANPFEHPDAQRRFRVMANIEELQLALDSPWDKWTVFLHPQQRRLIERIYSGSVRVSGSAGTGKTVVAVHRAVWLVRNDPNARVLLATFSDALANALRSMVRRLIGNEPRLGERIEVQALDVIGQRLYVRLIGPVNLVSKDVMAKVVQDSINATPENSLAERFVTTEWNEVVDPWQVGSWESYRDVPRLGRKTRLSSKARLAIWSVFEKMRYALQSRGLQTQSGIYSSVADTLKDQRNLPFDYIVLDECQDLSVAQLKFLSIFARSRPDALFFTGDIGQRIFQQPFSWRYLGVDVRGRSVRLKINYRTSHQIRARADRLLDHEMSDVDGIAETRRGTTSTFNGLQPHIETFPSVSAEHDAVRTWLSTRLDEGVVPGEIGIFVRSPVQLRRAQDVLESANLPYVLLDERLATNSSSVSLCTMHLAKGLEFRTVAVMGCDEDVIPLKERIEAIGDDADIDEVYQSERRLLYVACTRARDHLFVCGVRPASEFLDDLMQ